jgi:elongation factor P
MFFEYDGEILEVVEFQHVKPGKGPAFVRAKVRNMRTGTLVERTYRTSEKIEPVRIDKKVMEYLYQDGDGYVFMDNTSYEQVHISNEMLGDKIKLLKPNATIDTLFHGQQIMGIELPAFLELEVAETDPGEKGNTVQNALKRAKLETGAEVQVPMFIEIGSVVKIDTRTMKYIERVSK